MKLVIYLFFLSSCSSLFHRTGPDDSLKIYSYSDVSGKFKLSRETKSIDKKIVTRHQLLGSNSKILEKSVLVSQLGSIQSKKKRLKVFRPLASEFTVWLDGKKYNSKMRLLSSEKSMEVTLDSPELKWKGKSVVLFPNGRHFCFFNQLPECLYHNSLLVQAGKIQMEEFDFFIIWDSYPFIQDQLSNIGESLFSRATIKFDGEIKNNFRYNVEVDGQLIVIEFSRSYDLVKLSWITQGITVVPPGQEVQDEE